MESPSEPEEGQIAILRKLGLEDKVKIYERNIESAKEYKAKLEEMLQR